MASKTKFGELMGGPLMRTCPRCASLVVANFCGRCGERFVEPTSGAWFRIQVESTARRTAAEFSRLESYPGEAVRVGARQTLTVQTAAEIDWLRNSAPRLLALRNSAILAPGGRRIPSADPVFACSIGVMESGIRGCMTQKARPAHCAFESTVLPLRDPMKSLSLVDQLEGAGRKDLARELVLGVLANLHRQGEKAFCPLFGRVLRLNAADVNVLPMQIAAALAAAIEAPKLLPLGEAPELQVRHGDRPATKPSAAVRLAVALRQRPRAVHPRADGPYDSADIMAGALVLRFATDLQQRMVDVVLPTADGELGERLSLQADDVDIHAGGLAVLKVDKLHLRVTDHEGGNDFSGAWQGGELPAGALWRVRRWRTGTYWVWNDAGALFLLSPERGWLLSALSGQARGNASVPGAAEYSSVRGVVSVEKEVAVLSAGGHRLTFLGIKQGGVPPDEPPLQVTRDLILPHPAREIGSGRGNALIMIDDSLAYGVNTGSGTIDVWGVIDAGTHVSLIGGYAVCEAGSEIRNLGPGHASGGPTWSKLQALVRRATERRPEAESWGLTDRQGRAPHRTTWGG